MTPIPDISCIIPAFNEEARIEAVLARVLAHPMIGEVIVVDDGSTDRTADRVRGTDARLIRLDRNGGKTAALAVGIAAARGELILLVDADLLGLEPWHLSALIAPVRDGRADLSISLRANAPWLWRRIGLDYISGERVMHRALVQAHLDGLTRLPKFGFEVFVNGLCIRTAARIAVVRWPGVSSPAKGRKYGWRTGLTADFGMMRDLFRSVRPMGLVRQIIRMRQLCIADPSRRA